MAWKRELLSDRIVNGNRSIRLLALSRGRAGIIIFDGNGVVVAVYDGGRPGTGAKYTVYTNGFTRVVPIPAGALQPAEAQEYIEMFADAVRDTERVTVDVVQGEYRTNE